MSGNYSEVRNFWDDFKKAYMGWAGNLLGWECCPTQNEIHDFYLEHQYMIQVYCQMHFHAQNCTHCDDLCEIQNM